jgi:gas vesicle protein
MTIKTTHVVGAALAGAAVGAAAVALTDKQTRKKLQTTYSDLNKKGTTKVKELQTKAQDLSGKVLEMAQMRKDQLTEQGKAVKSKIAKKKRKVTS